MKLSSSSFLYFIIGTLLFILMDPYFIWSLSTNKTVISIIPIIFFWYNIDNFTYKKISLFTFFIIILFLAAIVTNSNIFGIIIMLLISAIPFVKRTALLNVYKSYRCIYTFFISISMIIWLLVVLGVKIPYNIIEPLNALKTHKYLAYPFLVIPDTFLFEPEGLYASIRFCGPFDEPGVVGTISFLMLLAGKFNLRIKQNIILFLSGIISFSLFFYIGIFIYLIYFLFVSSKKKYSLIILLLAISFYTFTKENVFLNQTIWNRIKWDEDKKSIVGNNRSGYDLDTYFDNIIGSKVFYFGLQDEKILNSFSGSASYKNAILTYGFLTLSLYIVFFLLYAYYNMHKKIEIFGIMMFMLLTFYQRPSFFSIYYILLFVIIIISHSNQTDKVHITENNVYYE